MNKIHTIINSQLEYEDEIIQLPFVVVSEEDGIFYFETRITDSALFEKSNRSFVSIEGILETGDKIIVDKLSWLSFGWKLGMATLKCEKSFTVIKANPLKKNIPGESADPTNKIYAFEIEGLAMTFGDHTEVEKYRRQGKMNAHTIADFDHTNCTLLVNDVAIDNTFPLILTDSKVKGRKLVEFAHDAHRHQPSYEDFVKFRKDLLFFLAFMNGGPILLTREFCGSFRRLSDSIFIDSEIVHTYSHRSLSTTYRSDYLPINKHHSYTSEIMPFMAIRCFDNYRKLNQTLDLNSLVWSLNDAYQAAGINEKFYILITALEKVSSNFIKDEESTSSLIDQKYFDEHIKTEIYQVLENHRSFIKGWNKIAFDIFKSRVGVLNRLKETDTKNKLYKFAEYCHIEISPYVKTLIDKDRNSAVHEGKVGEEAGKELAAYLKLDHLLRDILLNLIGYDRKRNPRIHYQVPYPYPTFRDVH